MITMSAGLYMGFLLPAGRRNDNLDYVISNDPYKDEKLNPGGMTLL
ncbi:MAG: hypothetical protein ACYDEE_11565 [Ignavibacteriaceae bacterium]